MCLRSSSRVSATGSGGAGKLPNHTLTIGTYPGTFALEGLDSHRRYRRLWDHQRPPVLTCHAQLRACGRPSGPTGPSPTSSRPQLRASVTKWPDRALSRHHLAHSCALRDQVARPGPLPTSSRPQLRASPGARRRRAPTAGSSRQFPHLRSDAPALPHRSCHACALFLPEDSTQQRGFSQRTGGLQQAPAAGGGRNPVRTRTASGRTGGTASAKWRAPSVKAFVDTFAAPVAALRC